MLLFYINNRTYQMQGDTTAIKGCTVIVIFYKTY